MSVYDSACFPSNREFKILSYPSTLGVSNSSSKCTTTTYGGLTTVIIDRRRHTHFLLRYQKSSF